MKIEISLFIKYAYCKVILNENAFMEIKFFSCPFETFMA